MSLIVRQSAKADLAKIVDYLAPRNPDATHRFLVAVNDEFTVLERHPGVGSLRSRVPKHLRGLRSWPVKGFKSYLIFFLPIANGVEIVRVLHGARNMRRVIRES